MYKVYAYACFYQSDTRHVGEIKPSEITITFISKNYPKKMMLALREERGLSIKKVDSGIYYLEGDEFAIQLIVTKKLSKEENYWLSCLRDDLSQKGEMNAFVRNYEKQKKNKWYEDLADTILRGNWKNAEEEKEVCDFLRELVDDMLKEEYSNGESKGESKGERNGARAIILDNLESGVEKEVILQKLQKFFQIDKEKAEEYFEENAIKR